MRSHLGFLLVIAATFCICIIIAENTEEITTNATILYQKFNATTPKTELKFSNKTIRQDTTVTNVTEAKESLQPSILTKILRVLYIPVNAFIHAPKVMNVLRNIGTCMVNGMMEIISYYLPAPLIPLITSTAGHLIPFEPIIMLRDKMPVASYRRAFLTAIRSFLGTFDKYRMEDTFDDDPYMMNQFNRRMMKYSSEEKTKKPKKKRVD